MRLRRALPRTRLPLSPAAGSRGTRALVITTAVAVTSLLVMVMVSAVVGFVSRPAAAVPAVTDCTGGASLDFDCYVRRYQELTDVAGAPRALDDLAARREASGYVLGACHQLTHIIGRAAATRDGIAAFALGDERCSAGFYHGVVEAVMAGIGAERIDAEAPNVCAGFRDVAPQSIDHYNCVHGMGHGFMEINDSDTFASLEGCDRLAGEWEREHCAGGVFMENLSAFKNIERPSLHLRPEDPLFPCTVVDARHKANCYDKQTAYALLVHDNDFAAVFSLCASSPDVEFRSACLQGVGGDVAITSNKQVIGDAAKRNTVRVLCSLAAPVGAEADCVTGAVRTVIRDGADRPGSGIDTAALCPSFPDPGLARLCTEVREDTHRRYPPGSGHAHS